MGYQCCDLVIIFCRLRHPLRKSSLKGQGSSVPDWPLTVKDSKMHTDKNTILQVHQGL
jgi:hypothetical protein